MTTETSNLNDYSAEHLSLLIESIDKHIAELKSINAFTDMVIAKDDHIAERMEVKLRTQIINRLKKLDDLYGLRVAMMNAHQIVRNRERVIQN